MQLFYIRHAQSENNLLYDTTKSNQGRNEDPELSELGRKQVKYLSDHLKKSSKIRIQSECQSNQYGYGFTHIYTSLMTRAIRTAVGVAEAVNLPLVGWNDIHEWGGIYLDNLETGEKKGLPGKSKKELLGVYPKLILDPTINEDGWWNNRPYESEEEQGQRAARVLAELLDRHGNTNDHVVFVSHGGFFRLFVSAVLGLQNMVPVWFDMNNCAISRFDFDTDEGVNIRYMNRHEHIPLELIS
jgi:2,3-bisphosphoglycerate-dependent phosphoglycerate mutase